MESFIRLNTRMSVDFPQPEGPMIAVIVFGLIASETLISAWKLPYQRLSDRVSSFICIAGLSIIMPQPD